MLRKLNANATIQKSLQFCVIESSEKVFRWLFMTAIVGNIFLTTTATASSNEDAVANLPSSDLFHPKCYSAFRKLPIDESGEAVDYDVLGNKFWPFRRGPGAVERYYSRYKAEYASYDVECFLKWSALNENTKQFLKGNVGTLFDGNNSPFCTATRLSATLILTARHCEAVMRGSKLRLLAYPLHAINVLYKIELERPVVPDLDDYTVWKIEDNTVPYTLSRKDFLRDFKPHQSITIVAVSTVARMLFVGDNVDRWIEAVRWSRTNSAQIWPSEEVSPLVADKVRRAECIFHKMPTFPGMSGAPILGVKRPSTKNGKPTIFVAGIHLRNGVDSDRITGCGEHPEFNIGIRIPNDILILTNP